MTFRSLIWIIRRPEVLLSLAAPVIGIFYAIGEHSGLWDRVSGREYAEMGVRRLETATGYPKAWIYNHGSDRQVFGALLRRLESRVPRETLVELRKAGLRPVLITVGGAPLRLPELPEQWQQSYRFSYTPGHPVLLIYGSKVDDKGSVSEGRAERVCSLGELNEQLSAEKAKWRFYIGTLMTSLLSIAFIILRFTMKGEQAKEAANKTARGAIPSESQGSDGTTKKKEMSELQKTLKVLQNRKTKLEESLKK